MKKRYKILLILVIILLFLAGTGILKQNNLRSLFQTNHQGKQEIQKENATEAFGKKTASKESETMAKTGSKKNAENTEKKNNTENKDNTEKKNNTEKIENTENKDNTIKAPTVSPKEATEVSITVHKSEHMLYLYNANTLIAQYKVALSKNPIGKKTQTGDKKVPEGEYFICARNAKSKFYLSLGLSYPNSLDAQNGYSNGLITKEQLDSIVAANNAKKGPDWYTNLGGEIMIHGGDKGSSYDWTTGCVAVDNPVMDILWQYCKLGTKVTINP